jgi:putative transposase
MRKAIHAQESRKAVREKAKPVIAELRTLKLPEAAKKVEDSIEETLTYADSPFEHWTRIRTNNAIRFAAGREWLAHFPRAIPR